MKFNDAEITQARVFCVVLFSGDSSLDSLSWTCSLTIENLEDTTHCDGRAVSAWVRPPHRFFHYKARRRPLPGSYHTLEHPPCSHPIATGGHPANPIDPPTDPVLTLQSNLHINPITPVVTQQVALDGRDVCMVSIAQTPNHRQPPMISVANRATRSDAAARWPVTR